MKKLLSVMLLFILCVFNTQSASVSLAWNPNSETNLAGYKIYCGTNSAQYYANINVGNVTNTTIYFLQSGITYFFVATAYDTSGLESAYSNEVSYTVPTNSSPSVPSAPTGFKTVNTSP